jgi:hypothetical protein
LDEQVWESHIQKAHPEVSLGEIKNTLLDPDEVWESQSRTDTELYYRKKDSSLPTRPRYWMVVVKKINAGAFVASAMTKVTMVGNSLVYKKA